MFLLHIKIFLYKILYIIVRLFAGTLFSKPQAILFIPHPNCIADSYDLFNYKSDNVLCAFRAFIENKEYKNKEIYLAYYNKEKLAEYNKFLLDNGLYNVKLFYAFDAKAKLFAISKSKFCFTDHAHYNFSYKTKYQTVICLSYFTPFKNDFYIVKDGGYKKSLADNVFINASYDYYVTTSDLSSRIQAVDLMLFYPKFIPLGFLRNDELYHCPPDFIMRLKKECQFHFSKIIAYAPTFRDSEQEKFRNMKNAPINRSLWGNVTDEEEKSLEELLESEDAIIVAKSHPYPSISKINKPKASRVLYFNDLSISEEFGLYELLAASDVLITDYTSASFDFLHRDKPIIYYFYDADEYSRLRGFSYDPIESFCAGPIVKTFNELLREIGSALVGKDDYQDKPHEINRIINRNADANSKERLMTFIKSIDN